MHNPGLTRFLPKRKVVEPTTMHKVIFLDDALGTAQFRKSARAKHMKLQVTPQNGLEVIMPQRVSYAVAKNFALEHKAWILIKIKRMQKTDQVNRLLTSQLPLIDRDEAKKILIKRCWELAHEFDFEYKSIHIRNQSTLWGSCTFKNVINLNYKLARLPQELIDYVVLHELNHTVHKNHSKRFWDALSKYCPGAKQFDKTLKEYHLEYL
ncbi:MAG: putative metal-dependent hydrolase [Candidatus Omnitrophota bacterium]|jgi:predicted metal-dependent hydrolase